MTIVIWADVISPPLVVCLVSHYDNFCHFQTLGTCLSISAAFDEYMIMTIPFSGNCFKISHKMRSKTGVWGGIKLSFNLHKYLFSGDQLDVLPFTIYILFCSSMSVPDWTLFSLKFLARSSAIPSVSSLVSLAHVQLNLKKMVLEWLVFKLRRCFPQRILYIYICF